MTPKVDTERKSYGVYVHIPFCRSKCAYCAFVSTPRLDMQRAYIDALVSEISKSESAGANVDTVYIGGGTPSCLFRGALAEIFSALRDRFDLSACQEITVEANPESCDRDFVDECVACGVNRVSIGLQSSDDRVLRKVGRIHDVNRFKTACVTLLSNGITNISSDLILGLPGQTVNDVENALSIMREYCSHISVYALTVEEGTPLYDDGYSPDDDFVAELYDRAVVILRSFGYERYEVSNFALPNKQSAHNKKYWACLPYIGFGAAAHGYDGYAVRYAHTDDIERYISDQTAHKLELTAKDMYNEYVMLALRTENGIDLERFERRFGYDFYNQNARKIDASAMNGYLVKEPGRIRISADKMFVMNGIIEDLMQ